MKAHIDNDRMHDLVDGLVPPAQEAFLREHLVECTRCAEEFAALEATVQALRGMPKAAVAPERMWHGIEARISADPKVIALPSKRAGPRRFSLTLPQLAAAAALVSLLSAAVVWQAMAGRTAMTGQPTVAGARIESPSARVASLGETGYDEAVLQLETILDQGRDVLAPETLATLESSLHTIDEAIAEVRVALASDPSSELLARLLANHQRSKLRVLRQAALSVQPRS